jgi:hypothetical protein
MNEIIEVTDAQVTTEITDSTSLALIELTNLELALVGGGQGMAAFL